MCSNESGSTTAIFMQEKYGKRTETVKQLEAVRMAAAKKSTRMLKYDEQYSMKRRTGDIPT